jgi:pyrimidine-nucleoside phosphorylase
VNLSRAEFKQIASQHGLVLAGQTSDLAPADKKLYALRDVTATVQSRPLIVSSIMSKKIASGANGIVLDVKVGSGTFMKTLDEARTLANLMVEIGTDLGRDMIALISDMSQPLGNAVGHALEVAEAIRTLRGEGPDDFTGHCLEIAAHMLQLAGRGQRWTEPSHNHDILKQQIANGEALQQFRKMVQVQGGNTRLVDDPSLLPSASLTETIKAEQAGFIASMHADSVARAAFELGAGRIKKGETIDLSVGVEVLRKVGDQVQVGTPLLTLHANDEARLQQASDWARKAVAYEAAAVEPLPLFYETIHGVKRSN